MRYAVLLLVLLAGCSLQGQRHYAKDGTPLSEWWSMRFCWMSAGIEAYTKTPYYESGALMASSRSDPNSIKATGHAGGVILGEIIKGVAVP